VNSYAPQNKGTNRKVAQTGRPGKTYELFRQVAKFHDRVGKSPPWGCKRKGRREFASGETHTNKQRGRKEGEEREGKVKAQLKSKPPEAAI